MAKMPGRWEHLLDTKPVPIERYVLDELGKLFAKDLSQWPPQVEDWEGAAGLALQQVVQERPVWPGLPAFREAFRLARWDLDHEHEAYDDYVRHERWLEHGLSRTDKALLLFLSRLITEQLLAVSEATEGRINRAARLEVLDRTEQRLTQLVHSTLANA